ncbi:HAT transposon superfamily [Melia azedarach]|nr:HAT transposon superfamily [Melia azedarach]
MQHKDNQGLAPPRATDPGWAHGTMVNGGRQKIKCKYCHKIFLGGGISRLKQHLAGERGNVAPCEEVPEEVKVQIQQHLGFKVLEKLKRQKGLKGKKNSFLPYFEGIEEGDDDDDDCDDAERIKPTSVQGTNRRRGKEIVEGTSNRTKRRKRQNFPAAPVVAQPLRQSFASQESLYEADMAVARFMYDAGLPFTAANSHFFQQMADAIATVGPGYKMPSYHSLRSKLLNRVVQDAGAYCEELKKTWEVTGCSVLVDRWMDRTARTVINFFVYCPKGTVFLKSVDASDITKSAEALLNLFDSVVQEVGPKNIVNFVTDTSPSYRAAGKLLMDKYKTFFCSTCGVQCIDIMLEEIGKIDEVNEALAKAKRITQFIYNNAWVLNLMRKKTGGRDILQLGITRFASIFLTLENIATLKDQLHQMFTGTAWMHSSFAKQRAGLEVTEIIESPLFWSFCDQTLKVSRPLLSVLHLMDCEERPSVGYVYDAMEKAKKSIIAAFDNKESDCMPYLNVIDHLWQEEFHSPLHAAAYYLNPSVFYNPSFSSTKVIQKGLLDCIETLEPNLSAQVMITSHINFYEEAVGDFGRPVALRGRESLAPATWWSLYAADYPELQRLAIRILSQTCSITRCGRNWSMFERIHSKKRNRLEHQRLNDLIFVHYNLHLQQRKTEAVKARRSRGGTLDPICLEAVDANIGDWVEDMGSMEGEDLSWMDVTVPSERTFISHELQNMDDSVDSSDDRNSEVTKGINGSDDL